MNDKQQIPETIKSGLLQLRRALKTWLLLYGFSFIFATLTGLILISFLIDRNLHMDQIQRAIFLILMAAGMIWVCLRYLVKPLKLEVSDEALALKVEAGNEDLDGSLISAYQLVLIESHPNSSRHLVEAVITEGSNAAKSINFKSVIDNKTMKRQAILLIVAILIPLSFALAAPSSFELWAKRNLLLQDKPWPRDTHVTLQNVNDGEIRIPAYSKLTILANIQGVIPETAVIQMRASSEAAIDEDEMAMIDNQFKHTFKNVSEAFQVKVLAGDGESDWVHVKLIPRPEFKEIRISEKPPAYTKAKLKTFPTDSNDFRILTGSDLLVKMAYNKPVASIELYQDDKLLKSFSSKDQYKDEITLNSDILQNGFYEFVLIDPEGIKSIKKYGFSLQLEADSPPSLELKTDGIGPLILQKALIPVTGKITDNYGIRKIWLDAQAIGSDGSKISPFIRPIAYKENTGSDFSYALDLNSYKLPLESTLSFRIKSQDYNPADLIGESSGFTFRIVSEEELYREFTRREQLIRQSFEQILTRQQKLQQEVKLLINRNNDENWNNQTIRQLQNAELAQRSIKSRLERLTLNLKQISDEIINNRLENKDGNLYIRLNDNIIQPLVLLNDKELSSCPELLQAAGSGTDRELSLKQAELQQSEILRKMKLIRKHMVKSKDFQEAIDLLRKIIDQQKGLNDAVKKEKQSEIEDIFE